MLLSFSNFNLIRLTFSRRILHCFIGQRIRATGFWSALPCQNLSMPSSSLTFRCLDGIFASGINVCVVIS